MVEACTYPYRNHTILANNGLMLMSDLHELFESHLISIDPEQRLSKLQNKWHHPITRASATEPS
ncbi:HNH endonuclease [Roseovarius aquimarinus]|uniref:HNH endonuclease n=1 Tax=Roseovarius aquimarinus TaxID=1229156 RepID=A0ABW7I7E4_9RHOB